MSQYILAIDQGTTGTTSSIVDSTGTIIAAADLDFEQIFPQPGWVEHNPEDIWSSVEKTVKNVLNKSKIAPAQIAAIGITNQRETTIGWNRKTGKPIHNAIVWQCRRTTDFCQKLAKTKNANKIRKLTGLVIDPYFSGSKMRWLLKNIPEANLLVKSKDLAVGTVDSFLVWRLSSGVSHITDVSNASRTQLMNLKSLDWDKDLLKTFGIPKDILPQIVSSSGKLAVTKGLGFLPDGIPIAGIAGDQQAALFGQTCFAEGEAKCTFGTGSFLLLNTGKKRVTSKHGLLTTVAWRLDGQSAIYALEGGAFVCGAAVQWMRDGLGFIKQSSEIEELARQVESSEGVEFVPALTGLGAPHWNAEARGLICGLTRGTTRAHLARATLEAMALQNVEILKVMQEDSGKKLKSLRVDGGATANDLLMQIQCDYLGTSVIRPRVIETTSLGAALLAGLGSGIFKDLKDIKLKWKVDKTFDPKLSKRSRLLRLARWSKAIRRAVV
jgi:glycerol kinase